MTGFTTVVARELQEWRRIFVAALVGGAMIILAPVIPGATSGATLMDKVNLLALSMAVPFGLGVALLAGGGLIGRDLVERRMSFHFYKPLPAASIWGGKMVAALMLAIFSALLALIPATLVGGGLLQLRDSKDLRGFGIFTLLMVVLVILGNSLQLSFRSRSRWVLLDLAGLLIIAGLLAIAGLPLVKALALGLVGVLIIGFAVVLLVALLVSGLVGLIRGRIDVREVHKFHAITLWSTLAVVAIALIGYSFWVRLAGPEDFRLTHVVNVAPNGPWVAVTGVSRGRVDYQSLILKNVENGNYVRVGGRVPAESIEFSDDGHRAMWLEPVSFDPSESRIMVATLGRKPVIRPTTIFMSPTGSIRKLSPDGTRLAMIQSDTLTVYDLDDERALGAVRLPTENDRKFKWNSRMYFLDREHVRLFLPTPEPSLQIYEFDLPQKRFTRTGTLATTKDFFFTSISGDRLLVRNYHAKETSIHNARTGKLLARLPEMEQGQGHRASLSDGRFVTANASAGQAHLKIFSPEIQLERTIELGPAQIVRIATEPAPGRLLVTLFGKKGPQQTVRESGKLMIVNLETGEIKPLSEKLSPALIPAFHVWWYVGGERPAPGSVATKLFQTPDDSAVIYFDPMTGERRLIAGRG